MQVRITILSEEEKQKIHGESVRILEEVGVRLVSPRALDLLADHGAGVDPKRQIAKIPVTMVERALETAPRSFALGARDPAYDLTLPASCPSYNLDGGVTYALDFYSGERRYGRTEDLERGLRVFEEMEMGTVVWPPVVVHDLPQNSALVRRFITSLKYTSKHLQDEIFRPEEVPYFIEACIAVTGSEALLRRRKPFSVVYCPVAPLVHDGQMSEAYLKLCEYEVPILIFPMPAAGSTGPASLRSNIALANAESLSCLVLFQTARPGTPLIYGNASGSFDFSTGEFLEGAPEMVLQTAALGEMARFYQLPNTQAGCLTDAKHHGPQAVLEKLLTTMPLVLSGVDVVQGIGALECSQVLSLEQIVVDHEIGRLCERLRQGLDFAEAKNYFRDIKEVGPGGNFLLTDSTVKACRSDEFLTSELLDRHTYESWLQLGMPDPYKRARERVEKILESPQQNPLSETTIRALDEIMERADREL
ncbi:MAG: trimethylamine methyltransferase family protein [Spirochaetaceae bacterium]|nr:MAG: trimethylamine methyltransferase family protein [Spirochaetaceae bacterium]